MAEVKKMIDITTEKIICVLLKYQEPVTSVQIAKEIGMSSSTVKHNIRFVREFIESTGASLRSIPGKGFQIICSDSQHDELEKMSNDPRNQSYSFDFRKRYILDILFRRNSNYTIQIFADDLGVNRTVISRDLELIRDFLSYFDLHLLVIKNRGVTLHGDEFNKRQAIIFINNQGYEDTEKTEPPVSIDIRIDLRFYHYFIHCYPHQDILIIQRMLKNAEQTLNFNYNDVSFTQMIEYIALTLERIATGNIIHEPNILDKCRISQEQILAAEDLINHALPSYSKSSMTHEYRCLAAQFALNGAYDRASSTIKTDYYEEIARQFLNKLNSIIVNQRILLNESIITDLGLILQKKKLQRSYQMMNGSILIQDIKKNLPSLYGIVMTNSQLLETKLHIKFSENDIAYITMLISNAMEEDLMNFKIALITRKDYNTSKYLQHKIEKNVAYLNSIELYFYDHMDLDFNHYDLVVSTVNAKELERKNCLLISQRVDDQDIHMINQKLSQIQKIKQNIIVSNNLFHEELVCLGFNARNKDEALSKGVEILQENGAVNEYFIENIKARESILPTSIGNGVSIPHEFKKNINQGAISILILDHPVRWSKEDKVDIIFTMALDFNTNTEVNNFFSRFYELISDEAILSRLRQAATKKEIMQILEDIGL